MAYRLLLTFLLLVISGCGSGGGGGGNNDSQEAATLSLDVTPDEIDSGDATTVRVFIDSINEPNFLLKVRYPTGLTYRRGTSILEVDGDSSSKEPNKAVSGTTAKFLVYQMESSDFGDNRSGQLSFILRGDSAVTDKVIEVDDDLLGSASSFDAAAPQFTPVDEADITVRDDASSSSSGSSSSSSSS